MTIDSRTQLADLMRHFNLPMTVAEIGVAEGRLSTEMYNWGLDHLYLVDIWERVPFIEGCGSFSQEWHDKNYEEVKARFIGKENVSILKGFSHKMAENVPDESLGLAYIDGDHTYNGVKSDREVWWPKLVPGGIMAFHDYKNPRYGVNRAVIEFVGEVNVNVLIEDGNIDNIGCYIRK